LREAKILTRRREDAERTENSSEAGVNCGFGAGAEPIFLGFLRVFLRDSASRVLVYGYY
jgi:hypothetical protein